MSRASTPQFGKKIGKAPRQPMTPLPANFEKKFFGVLSPSDAAILTDARRKIVATNFWHFLQQRRPGQALIRVFNPDEAADGWQRNCSVVEIVHDDMPFLVDSAMGAINSFGLTVHLVVHPILRVRRDEGGALQALAADHELRQTIPESCTHIQCDEIRDPLQLKALQSHLQDVFSDVRAAVGDWRTMLQKIDSIITEIDQSANLPVPANESDEVRHFLLWLRDNNYTFLGYRVTELKKHKHKPELLIKPKSGLGVLRDENVFVFSGLRDLAAQPPEVQRFVQEPRMLLITKTNLPATVHRPVPMDGIFIKRFDAQGNVIGEHLFVGLFTSYAYARSPREIPCLRQKVSRVLTRANFDPVSHDGKALTHILDNYPRDELYQIGENDLYNHAIGILQLQERQQLALFVRQDSFERTVTCLIYVPRDQYDSNLRAKFKQVLEASFGGRVKNFDVRIDGSPLARVLMAIATTPGSVPKIDMPLLEQELRDLARPWNDRLRDRLHAEHGIVFGRVLAERFNNAFPQNYREATDSGIALHDIAIIEGMADQAIGVSLRQSEDEDAPGIHLRIYHRGAPLALSQILPMIENMGLYVTVHHGPYVITPQNAASPMWLHDFVVQVQHTLPHSLSSVQSLFEDGFRQVWAQKVPDDGFNQLILRGALPWRAVNVIRTLAKYAHQVRAPQSRQMMIATLAKHPRLTQIISALFHARHDPQQQRNAAATASALLAEAQELLANVPNLDEDRVIRRFLNLVQASLRTNYFQTAPDGFPKDYLAIKFDCAKIEGLPLPRPLYEVFIASARTDAVHLRGGKVARGGIRWSDRHDDFRTEILGLMKAQMVKNSVIVPVGAKGGFIVKQPNPENPVAEAIACYRIMMCGLLDITDNQVNGKIVPPANVVRHDGDDPYLVVAADKGTAKFSDIANGISLEYGFWLGDAFASGGSVGYDHKHMGITARGAWEAVKRHFREIGKDIQQEDFTCIGVGDMSGDVFGNGMLLSKHTLMLGAFDHRHIFCDPTPDAAKSLAERQRLFKLPTSSWVDYDPKLISKGGGVFARNLKNIKISPAMQAAYHISADSLSPAELIQAMLRAPVELLYFGGIGTYVKAASERNEEVGDRANDALRVDGGTLRAKVIGEGANLAMTQRGRVDYALKGGRLNTDAIDNSAGVDTSDHEVNIKIALSQLTRTGKLTIPARNKLLTSMTDEVAGLVLRDNYMQTQALSLTESQAAELLGSHARVMRMLERSGLLNRAVEFLPDDDMLAERQRLGQGLTRPELAVLLAYAKIWLYQQLLASSLPDDPFMATELQHYFPAVMQKNYADAIKNHQLRREIIATGVTNSLINHAGIHFVMRMAERSGRSAAEVTQSYLLAREVFDFLGIWREIRVLDNKVPAIAQTTMRQMLNQVLRRSVPWFLTAHGSKIALDKHIPHYQGGVKELEKWLTKTGTDLLSVGQQARVQELKALGVPAELALRVTRLNHLAAAPDLQSQAALSKATIADAAEIYFQLDQRFGFEWLRDRVQQLPTPTPWQRDAAVALSVDSFAVQRALTAAVLKGKGKNGARFQSWCADCGSRLTAAEHMLQELRAANAPDLAMLMMATRQLAALAD